MVLEWGEERDGSEIDREKAKRSRDAAEKVRGGVGKRGKHTAF